MNRLKINKAWWAVLLLTANLLMASFLPFLQDEAAAAPTYQYSDSKYSSIIGPDPYDSSVSQTFTKGSGNDGKYYNTKIKQPDSMQRSSGCTGTVSVSITTNSHKYNGDSGGRMKDEGCISGNGSTRSLGAVTINKVQALRGGWIDHSHLFISPIDGGTKTFVDGKIDDTVTFKIDPADAANDGCEVKSHVDGFPHSGDSSDGKNVDNANASVKLHFFKRSTAAGNNSCLETIYPVKMGPVPSDGGNYNAYFTWRDAGTISTSDGTTMIFQQGQGSNEDKYFGPADGSCKSYIKADPKKPANGKLIIQYRSNKPLQTGFPDFSSVDFHNSGDCKVSDPISIKIANPVNKDGKAASTLAAGSANVGNDVAEDENGSGGDLGCSLGWDGANLKSVVNVANPLNWLLCGIVKGLGQVVNTLDSAINSQLSVGTDGNSDNPNQIFEDSNGCSKQVKAGVCDAYHKAWASFRNIALGLMVIAGLIILVSQALDMEILSAYTIRKLLPRLLVASIAITLSWQLMQFFVTLTNDLGYGIRYLIYQPFNNAGLNSDIYIGTKNSLGLLLIGFGGLAVFGLMGLLSYIGTAALAVLIAFMVLILRQIAIIMLIILAPIGIVAYILPNTQRIYKLWWESFSKALLMFPLIAGFIAAGRIFSAIAAAQPPSFVNTSISFIAYFAPYFMIPLTFRFAGGALGAIGGFVNDRGKGGFDRLRGFRGNRAKQNMATARAGKRWNEDYGRFKTGPLKGRSIGGLASKTAMWGLDADEMVPWKLGSKGVPGFRKYAAKAENEIDAATIDHSTKAYQELESKGGMHYEGWRALSGSYHGFSAETQQKLRDGGFIDENGVSRGPTNLADIDKMTEILGSSSNEKEQLAAQGLRTGRGIISSINTNPEMFRTDIQTMGALGLAAQGRADNDDLAAIGNSLAAKRDGNSDYAQRVVKKASDVGAQKRPETRFGHGVKINEQGRFESALHDPKSKMARGNALSIKSGDWAGAKAEAVKAMRSTNMLIATEQDANGNLSPEAEAIRSVIAYHAGPYGSGDPGAKAEWSSMAKELGMDLKDPGYDPNAGEKPAGADPLEPPQFPDAPG